MPLLLTDEQIYEIKAIIEKHHAAVVLKVLGPEALSVEEVQKLKDAGLYEEALEAIKDSYLYGQLVGKLASVKGANLSYAEFQAEVKKNPIPLSRPEELAIEAANHNAGTYIRGLGNKVFLQAQSAIFEEDQAARAELLAGVRTEVAENIAKRKGLSNLKKKLRELGEGRDRDWFRVAITEKHNAMQQGLADYYHKEHGGDSLVFKRPMPDACKHCRRLHLGSDGHPRIFKLSYLQSNGTNVGVKAENWNPVVGAVHPWCLPGHTKVQTVRGEIPIQDVFPGEGVITHEGTWRPAYPMQRLYEGDLITIRTEHGMVECLPDHAWASCGGWKTAEKLEPGDHLVRVLYDRVASLAVEAKSKDLPSEAVKGSSLARVLFFFSGAGVPITAIDLDGQLFIYKGEVDVEDTNSEARDWGLTPASQLLEKLTFVRGPDGALIRLRTGTSLFDRVGPTPSGLVCGGRYELPISEGGPLVPEFLRVAIASLSETVALESVGDGHPRASKMAGYGLYGEQFFKVESDHLRIEEVGAAACHEVVLEVSRRHVKMLVYNLSVPGPESYVAGGFVSHNCQCQLQHIPEGWGFDEDGDMVPGGPFGKIYESPEEAAKAMQLEDELQKAFAVQSRINWRGLPIAIEHPIGSKRPWKDDNGETQYTEMKHAYGYVEGTLGPDGDEYDVFLGPDPMANLVYVVHQRNVRDDIEWDEDKAFIGFSGPHQAKEAYLIHYDTTEFYGSMSVLPFEEFAEKLQATTLPGSFMSDGMVKGAITPVEAAAGSNMENRNASGTGVNLVFSDVAKYEQPRKADVIPVIQLQGPLPARQVKDLKPHLILTRPNQVKRPVVIPEHALEPHQEARTHAPENKAMVQEKARSRAEGAVPNNNETEEERKKRKKGKPDSAPTSKPDHRFTLEKAGPFTKLKKAAPAKTPWRKHG